MSSISLPSRLKRTAYHLLNALTRHIVYEDGFAGVSIKRRGGLGFLRRHTKQLSPEERFLSGLDLKGMTIYDVGGYIGLVAIFFARKAGSSGRVIVFEPNPDNCATIQDHLVLNEITSVDLLPLGLAAEPGRETLVMDATSAATGTISSMIGEAIRRTGAYRQMEVTVETLDRVRDQQHLPPPDLIKLDIEGLEVPALLGMAQTVLTYGPALYIEVHGADLEDKEDNVRRLLALLTAWQYSVWHVESAQMLTSENVLEGREGHLYGTPQSSKGEGRS